MKILDLDMDYFMDDIASGISESKLDRLSEDDYGMAVWNRERVINFLESHLGLSKKNKIKGRIVAGHNGSLVFWKELILKGLLNVPFEVIHVDSHADLGLGYSSWKYILEQLIQFPVKERSQHNRYMDCFGKTTEEGIGDYLLFAIAYRWISRITYCANPKGDKNDYLVNTLKGFHENYIWDKPVENIIQLAYNPNMDIPDGDASEIVKQAYFANAKIEPEVPMLIIPTIEDVKFDGNFDYAVMAQSPNYTPASADYIMDIFREYIEEI